MKKNRRGVFLITASTAAIRPRGGHVYAASKGAMGRALHLIGAWARQRG